MTRTGLMGTPPFASGTVLPSDGAALPVLRFALLDEHDMPALLDEHDKIQIAWQGVKMVAEKNAKKKVKADKTDLGNAVRRFHA